MEKNFISIKSIIAAIAVFVITAATYVLVIINFYTKQLEQFLFLFSIPFFISIFILASSSTMNIKSTGLVTLKNSVGYDVFNGKIIRFNATVDINFFPSQVDSLSLIKIKERENMPDYKIARSFLKISFNDGTTRYFCVSFFSKKKVNEIIKKIKN